MSSRVVRRGINHLLTSDVDPGLGRNVLVTIRHCACMTIMIQRVPRVPRVLTSQGRLRVMHTEVFWTFRCECGMCWVVGVVDGGVVE